MSNYYILVNRVPVPCDLHTWAASLKDKERYIGHSKMPVGRVSTVFLGLNHHQYGVGPPLIFEMMVFIEEDKKGEVQFRCSTWDQAKELHLRGIRMARSWHHCPEAPRKRRLLDLDLGHDEWEVDK